jgi:acyl carrier protein
MTIDERIANVIAVVFALPQSEINEHFTHDSTDKWTSLAHLTLILALEEEFHTTFSDQEAVEMLSFKLIRVTLQDKGVDSRENAH